MNKQKRVAAIHDISGLGKCSLTVALPILSAAGIEACPIPTAILSTHTGGFIGYTYRDLTEDLPAFVRHWKSLPIEFDALYSGFLGSFEQLEIVSEIFDTLKTEDTLILADPVMGDGGKLYTGFSQDFVRGMKKLCAKAHIIVPNMTEAALMLEEAYREGPYEKSYIERLLRRLGELGSENIVLTGVFFDDKQIGAAAYDKKNDGIGYALSPCVNGLYHGTGDIFASALLAALLNDFDLYRASEIAVRFVTESIDRTAQAGTDTRYGVNFEQSLPGFMTEVLKPLQRG